MANIYFSHNGTILPAEQAVISLSNIEYAYGFGVYETIRVSNGVVYFANEHAQRLMESASAIGLEHPFFVQDVKSYVDDLVAKASLETSNLKILLVGGRTKNDAQLYIQPLNPLFPPRQLYRDGVHCVTYEYERLFPHAKTLNMLPSYLAYRQAKAAGGYDALLVDRNGCIAEGTRTNFMCIQGDVIVSPPEDEILLGVMRKVVLKVALAHGFTLEQRTVSRGDIAAYDGAFLTSTSTKILPIKSIDTTQLSVFPKRGQELQRLVNEFLSASQGLLD